MRCPCCGHLETQVKDSRPCEDLSAVRRRRYCLACGRRFTTVERIQMREMTVMKRNGQTMPFDRDKLSLSIQIALRKRPFTREKIEMLVTEIMRKLEASNDKSIQSSRIGELAMESLKAVDTVGYVRFASVYRDFREVQDFSNMIENIEEKKH